MRLLLPGLLLAVLLAPPATAVPILDQSSEPPDLSAFASIGDFERAQTFTVGLTGILTSVEVLVSRNTAGSTLDLDVRILPTASGAPDEDLGNALATVTVPDGVIPVGSSNADWISVDLTPFALSVTAGDVLAIALQTSLLALDQQDWTLALDNYAGGEAFFRTDLRDDPSDTWESAGAGGGAFDFGFRTFVEVPEPGAIWLAASVALAVRRRR